MEVPAQVSKLVESFIGQQDAALRQLRTDLLALFAPAPAGMPQHKIQECLREASRLSCCGYNAELLRETFLTYLGQHDAAWFSVFDMCTETKAWEEFGRPSVKLVLKSLEGLVEYKNMPPNFLDAGSMSCYKSSRIRLLRARRAPDPEVY